MAELIERLRKNAETLRFCSISGANQYADTMDEAATTLATMQAREAELVGEVALLQAAVERLTNAGSKLLADYVARGNELEAIEGEVAALREAATPLLAQFDAYRDSDLNHECAHRFLVRYTLWGELAAAVAIRSASDERG